VAAAFDLPPDELTTTEFCRAIAGHDQIAPELSAALSDFLRQCDQRKFSPSPPTLPLSAAAHALKLIDQAQTRRLALARPQ
jgi:7-keto-8-aminopelargonate synthetase-like enzyme